MKTTSFITILTGFLSVTICLGQEQSIVPVSPEAAALTKMVNYPVSFYTGIPDISIPLYEIKVGELTLPISLQYHSGGFKVNERHTREGLGWSLSCDLQITRTINGADDFFSYGYAMNKLITSQPFPFNNPQGLFPSHGKYRMATGEIDGQPDKFTYRLLGKTGSFFIAKNSSGTSYSFVPVPTDNIKIEFLESQGMFVITDSDGTIYHFSEKELTGDASWKYSVTSWKCTKVINNLGIDVFSFEYTSKNEVINRTSTDCIEYYSAHSYNTTNFYSNGKYYRSDQDPLSSYPDYHPSNSEVPFYRISNPKYIQYFSDERLSPSLYVPYYDISSHKLVDKIMPYNSGHPSNPYNSSSRIAGCVLSKIVFRGGKVEFIGSEQLTKLLVSDTNNQIVKNISFYHSFKSPIHVAEAKIYNGSNFNGTMYLDSIKMGVGANNYET